MAPRQRARCVAGEAGLGGLEARWGLADGVAAAEQEGAPAPAHQACKPPVINGDLDNAETRQDPIFDLHVPVSVPGVDAKLLDPVQTWPDPAQFEETARKLADAFRENFKQYESMVSPAVVAAGPLV